MYYINWRTGMKAKEDPRTAASAFSGDFYSEDDSSYDSEGSSSESSPSSSVTQQQYHHQQQYEGEEQQQQQINQVLVVAGCKGCLMYFMVPKQVGVCPKCCGQLLHFDRSESDWILKSHISSDFYFFLFFLFGLFIFIEEIISSMCSEWWLSV